MFKIRLYTENDYKMISKWAVHYNELPPTKGMLPLNTTFICEIHEEPSLIVTAYYTNCKEISYLDHYFGNPEMAGTIRQQAGIFFLNYMEHLAKSLGYKKIICFAYKDKVKKRYEEMGFVNTANNISSFLKELN